ncbi:carboxypeptidase M32 [Fervidobacterium thailandense]|nr:carboxypeptidase M32 [Fervidobacterium thailandense]
MNAGVEMLKKYYARISKFSSAASLLYWDMQTYMPKMAGPFRAEALAELSGYVFQLATSDELGALLEDANPQDEVEEAIVRVGKREFERFRKIPKELFEEFVKASTLCEQAWQEAKRQDNFKTVEPFLQKVVELSREIAEKLGYEKDPYDALIDQFEPGMTAQKVATLFSELREFTIALLERIEKLEPVHDVLSGVEIEPERQRKFNEWLLDYLGFDRSRGRLDVSEHPFTNPIGLNDVRITTRYVLDDIKNSIFSTIHEFGHALYSLSIPQEFYGLPIGSSASYGFDESQSRFWENIVGRSLEFWKGVHGKFIELFPEFSQYDAHQLWKSVNVIKRSYIRTEADELTYNLHIILRFELEHALINGELKVQDIPSTWNEYFEKYVGLKVSSDRMGCLQDPHWYGGSFGYFPSYTLGNLYSAQIKHSLSKELPFEQLVEEGNFEPIKSWLYDKIYSKGKIYEPEVLIEKLSGEPLNVTYFRDYISEKAKRIFNS